MNSRAEVTTSKAKAHVKAAEGDKCRTLDEVVGVTGWSWDNARLGLCAAAKLPPGGSGRGGGKETAVAEVFLRRGEGAAAGVGCVDRPVLAASESH